MRCCLYIVTCPHTRTVVPICIIARLEPVQLSYSTSASECVIKLYTYILPPKMKISREPNEIRPYHHLPKEIHGTFNTDLYSYIYLFFKVTSKCRLKSLINQLLVRQSTVQRWMAQDCNRRQLAGREMRPKSLRKQNNVLGVAQE